MDGINQKGFEFTQGDSFQGIEEDRVDFETGDHIGQSTQEIASGSELRKLLERQQYCCSLSGLPLTPETAVVDHIQPVCDEGNHTINNLQWLHNDVNLMKGSMSTKRFTQLVTLIADTSMGLS